MGESVAVSGLVHCLANRCFLHDSRHPMSAMVLLDADSMADDDLNRALKCEITDTTHCLITIRGTVETTNNPRVPGIDPSDIDWPDN